MKKIKILLIITLAILIMPSYAQAQYTSIVNQAANILQTAVLGGSRYRGFVEATYTAGIGDIRANFLGISTTHGFQMTNWLFMGAGLGVDYVYSHIENKYQGNIGNSTRGVRSSGAMVPLYTDFRFDIGSRTGASFFIDIKAGGEFLIGKNYLAIENGYISGSEYFMLRPSIGVRIPTGPSGKQAVDIGLTYQLLTCNYWYSYSNHDTMNSLGGTISFEW